MKQEYFKTEVHPKHKRDWITIGIIVFDLGMVTFLFLLWLYFKSKGE